MPDAQKIIQLLEENNSYLKSILELQRKKLRDERNTKILQITVTILPYLALTIAGYIAWQWIAHYMDIMNNNIHALKSNFDTMRDFLQKIIPDFSSISGKIHETWNGIKIWK
jgi:hypothetical protein